MKQERRIFYEQETEVLLNIFGNATTFPSCKVVSSNRALSASFILTNSAYWKCYNEYTRIDSDTDINFQFYIENV